MEAGINKVSVWRYWCVFTNHANFRGQGLVKQVAQEIKALVAKPENLSLTPRTHTSKGEN